MTRNIWKPALALGAVLAVSGIARAGDRDTVQLSGSADKFGAATMTLGGTGTAAQAATEDNELTHGYRYGGYRGWGGGYGYRGYYGGGWNRGWGGYGYGWNRGYYGGWNRGWGGWGYPRTVVSLNFNRPYYGGWGGGWGGYYRPSYFYSSSFYSYPVYSNYYCDSGLYLGIGGGTGTAAPAVTLGGSNFAPPVVTQPEFAQPMAQPGAPEGTFPYDGGPSNPVPLPNADPLQPQQIPPAIPDATDLPVSGKAKPGISPAKTPYKYKAYGEK
jgi:hypothetical protein